MIAAAAMGMLQSANRNDLRLMPDMLHFALFDSSRPSSIALRWSRNLISHGWGRLAHWRG